MGKRKSRFLTKNQGHTDDHTESPNSDNDLVVSYKCDANGKMIKIKRSSQHSPPCSPGMITRSKHPKCIGRQLSGKRSKMDSGTFDEHLATIWRSFSEDKRAAFAHLDSFYFMFYKSKRPRALEMIKKKEIFSKKYVFVPIVCWDHWRLVIFCHFGEAVHSKVRTRCILLLDSVEMSANLIGADVRKFVFDIFKAEGRPESEDLIYQIPLVVPKVPQQTNDVDCGRFVLYFIKQFMDAAPENFSLSNGYPYFLTSDWFCPEHFANFCDTLEEKPTPEQVPRRFSQRIRYTSAFAQNCDKKLQEDSRKCPPPDEELILVDDDSAYFGRQL